MSYYTYILRDPRTNAAFYVGKGKGNRITAHEAEAIAGKQSAKCMRIREIWDAGLKVRREFDAEHATAELALDRERMLIKANKALLNVSYNDDRPVLVYFTEAMARAIWAEGIEQAKAYYRWITHFPYERMSSDFERRVWKKGRDCVLANRNALQELDAHGLL